jgi:muconate cycloisomerase
MSIQLASLQCRIVWYPINEHRLVFSCAGRHSLSEYLVVVAEDASGARGYGEAATVPIWSGETGQAGKSILEAVLAPALVGSTFDHPREVCDVLDRVLIGNSFLKGAVDTAAWDLWARLQQRSVSSVIADRDPVTRIPIRASIAGHGVEKTVELAREFWDLGIKTLKFKTGLDTEDDCRRLEAVRNALGEKPRLTVDYNNGLSTLPEAVAAIESLLPYDLVLVEQPTPRDRLNLMAQVRRRVDVPILADEGIFNTRQLEEAIELEALDMLSVYPGKNGGFTRSLEMSRMAQQAGIPCVIGSNQESDLGQAAMGCLAASLTAFPVDQHPCDLGAMMYYLDAETTLRRPLDDGRYCVIDADAGFGVTPRLPR